MHNALEPSEPDEMVLATTDEGREACRVYLACGHWSAKVETSAVDDPENLIYCFSCRDHRYMAPILQSALYAAQEAGDL